MPENQEKVTLREVFGLQLQMNEKLSKINLELERMKTRTLIIAFIVSLSVSVGVKVSTLIFNLLPLP